MISSVAVGQRQRPQQLPHTVGPPALDRLPLGEQVADRLAAPNEHGALPQQAGFIHIAVALKARTGEIRIAEEGEGFEHAAHGRGARQGPQGVGVEGQAIGSTAVSKLAASGKRRDACRPASYGATTPARPQGLQLIEDGMD